jgi:ribosome maturation factor RimP
MATTTQRLDDIITPIVTELGLELFDLEFASSTVRVTIDKAPVDGRPGVIDLGDITAVTRAVSRALDEHDPIAERYSLEVSSPGLERTLRTPRHFERAIGQLVSVKTVPHAAGERRVKGTLTRAGAVGTAAPAPDDVEVDVAAADSIDVLVDGAVHTIAYADIDKARTVFEWGPEPRPSKPKPKPAAKTKTASKAAASDAASSKQPKPKKKKKVNAS